MVSWCYFGTGVAGHLVMFAAIVLMTWVVLPPWSTVLPLTAWAALTWWGFRLYRKARASVIVLFVADLVVVFAYLALIDAVGDVRP